MKTTTAERNAKIELLIEFLNTKSKFNASELCATLQISKTMPFVLRKAGYLKSFSGGIFEPTDIAAELTSDKYKELMTDYHKVSNNKAKVKKIAKKPVSIAEFLNSKKNGNDSVRELAMKINELLKPYLNN